MKRSWNKKELGFTPLKRVSFSFVLLILIFTMALPLIADAADISLKLPLSVTITNGEQTEITSPYEMTLENTLNITYQYDAIADIDSDIEYELPPFPAEFVVNVSGVVDEETGITSIPLTFNNSTTPLGTLHIAANGVMSLQFDTTLNGSTLRDFFLTLAIKLDKNSAEIGDEFFVSFDLANDGQSSYQIKVVGEPKDEPTLKKTGPFTGTDGSISGFDPETNEITWTVDVTQGEDPYTEMEIRDQFSENQEYVEDSLLVNGAAPAAGSVSVDEENHTVIYSMQGISPNQQTIITYKTRIKADAFLNAHGVPLQSGNIKCTNQAQAYLLDDTGLGVPAKAEYNHAIIWLYKTSGTVINRATGEMEWTIIIYSNGLSMSNVMLYDRLSPGIVVKSPGTATLKVGNTAEQTLSDFQRNFDDDEYLNGDSAYAYNLSYPLPGTIAGKAVVTYRTVIENIEEYNAAANMPPNSMFDNRAFITYELAGGGSGGTILSPVVEKDSAFETGLLGKVGTVDNAPSVMDISHHTITWTLTVNENGENLRGVSISDAMTRNGTEVSTPITHTVHEHFYEDLLRNRPTFTCNGTTVTLSPYDASNPNQVNTYKMLTDTNGKVYDLVFYLGDLNAMGTLVFRTTVADPNIYASQNAKGENADFENKAMLTTADGFVEFASAEVNYKSQIIDKTECRNWFGQREGAYDFNENRFPWQIIYNQNRMEMKSICISDILAEGTSLVPNSVRIGGDASYYNMTVVVPQGSTGSSRPYYTYDEATRELRVYPEDVTGDDIGTDRAIHRIGFYVQVDVDSILSKEGPLTATSWQFNNTATIYTEEQPDGSVSPLRTSIAYPQMAGKTGKVFNNNGEYSIDYAVNLNRMHEYLPDGTEVVDNLPAGLALNVDSVRLYSATVTTAGEYTTVGKSEGGVFTEGAEIDSGLYKYKVTDNADGTSTFVLTLPDGTGDQRYILKYSCIVTDISKAPFTNNIKVGGYEKMPGSYTVKRVDLVGASAGGTIISAKKTSVSVLKTDILTDLPLANAEFGLYYKGNLILTGYTDVSGRLLFEDLTVGREYEIRELTPPEGYALAENPSQTFTAADPEDPDYVEQVFAFADSQTEGTLTVTVTKQWENDTVQNRPEEIFVQLYRDGTAYGDSVALNEDNGWYYAYTYLDDAANWSVDETGVPEKYSKEVSHTGNDWVITNTYRGVIPPTGVFTDFLLWVVSIAVVMGISLSFLYEKVRKKRRRYHY